MLIRPACQILSEALDISSATARVALDLLLDALAILSATTVSESAVDWEDLKPYWKSGKKPYLRRWLRRLLVTSFWKTLLTTERRLPGW